MTSQNVLDETIYLTTDLSTRPFMSVEFLLLAPCPDPQHLETLEMLATFAADPAYRVGEGAIINIGRPWFGASKCDHLLASKPYPFGPELEWCRVTDDELVRILWATPITESEAAYGRTNGFDALEALLESTRVDILDPLRPSVI